MPAFFIDKTFEKTRHRIHETSTKWIFCDKVTIKKDYKKETLTNCEEKIGDRSTAQKTIHRASVLQQDHKIIKLCENFLAAEAKYHRTCYKEFTRPPETIVAKFKGADCGWREVP